MEASRRLFGLPSSPQPLPILSVAPPDTHRRFSFNLRCVSGGATEGIRCGVGEIGCASASTDGAGTSGSESHEGSDWFEIGHGRSRLGKEGRRTVTLVMSVSICGCELYSLCKRHSPEGIQSMRMPCFRRRLSGARTTYIQFLQPPGCFDTAGKRRGPALPCAAAGQSRPVASLPPTSGVRPF